MTIKEARLVAGLTQRQSQELTGVPSRTWEAWEMGERKPSAWVEKIIITILLHNDEWIKMSHK